jgi:glycosyltransferase involved in cell wall biosynthesis
VSEASSPAVWFLAVRSGSGADVFTERLAAELQRRGNRAEISWLPHRAEYAPWTVTVPEPPAWASVVHINTWLHPRFLPKRLPVVATLHHSIHHPDLARHKGWLRLAYHKYWIRPVERRTIRRADRVVAVSKFAADTARKTLLDRPMAVICNGVDIDQFRPSAQRGKHRPFRLLYVGKWVPLKGVDMFAPIMRALGKGFELSYTGGSQLTKQDGIAPTNMHNLGRLRGSEEVVAAMQSADAFLFPSRSEGFPLVVVEAMACGLAVVAMQGSSLSEAVEDGVTGVLCGQGDIRAIATACRRLEGDGALQATMSAAARARAVKFFSISRMVDAYLGVYLECATACRAAP